MLRGSRWVKKTILTSTRDRKVFFMLNLPCGFLLAAQRRDLCAAHPSSDEGVSCPFRGSAPVSATAAAASTPTAPTAPPAIL